MGRRERNTALLKLLVAVAWADGKIQASELNFIKRLVLRFGLDDDIWAELEPYLEEQVDDAERQALAGALNEHLRLPGARGEVLGMLEHMTGADQTVTPDEKEALQQIRAVHGRGGHPDADRSGLERGRGRLPEPHHALLARAVHQDRSHGRAG